MVGRSACVGVLLSLLCLSCGVSAGSNIACEDLFSSVVLSGSTFQYSSYNDSCNGVLPIFTQQGVPYNAPELRVVANTTVTFNITAHSVGVYAFGLSLSNDPASVANGGAALGLTPTADSVCFSSGDPALANTFVMNHTLNDTTLVYMWATQPCTVTWQVPMPNNTTQYYYFVTGGIGGVKSTPRRINIVTASDIPSSSSSSAGPAPYSSSSSSSTGSSASTGTSSTPTSPTPTVSSSTFSSSSSSSGFGTGSSTSSTPSPTSGSSSPSAPSSSSSSSTGGPNSSSSTRVNFASVVLAVIGGRLLLACGRL